MADELILFNKGLAWDVRSALQQQGFLKTAKNINFVRDHRQGLRPMFSKMHDAAVNDIHSVKRFRDNLIIGDDSYLRWKSALDSADFVSLGSTFGTAAWFWHEYKDFLVGVNGISMAMFDVEGNLYNPVVDEPATPPSLADSGVAGDPDGTYIGYVTFLLTFPNGMQYETGFSEGSADVTVVTNKISWTDIPVCTYAALSGDEPTIHRKLYRGPGTGGTLAEIYYVDTITDNSTTTYTDEESDSQLAANGVSYSDDYTAMPIFKYHTFHYGRWYGISAENTHRMWYSEAAAGTGAEDNEIIMPIATESLNWDDLRVAGFEGVDPQGLIDWGTYLYIPLKQTWIKKQGNDPDNWSFKKTWADYGVGAPQSAVRCGKLAGILSVTSPIGDHPALALFNGQISSILSSPQFDHLFEEDMNPSAVEECKASWDGRYYHLLYPSGSSTVIDKHAAFDMSRYPDIRLGTWEDLNGQSIDTDQQSSGVYIGGSDGFVRQNSGDESIDIEVRTHDLIGTEAPLAPKVKTLKEIKYMIDTGGAAVSLEIYIDDELATWPDGTTARSIEGSDDTVQLIRSFPPNWEGYKYALKLTGSELSTLELYGPWEVSFNVTL